MNQKAFLESYVRALAGEQTGAPYLAFSDLLDQSSQGYFWGYAFDELLRVQNQTIDHLESITDISNFTLVKIFDPYQEEATEEIKAAYKYGFRTAARMILEALKFIHSEKRENPKPENLGQ